MSCPEAEMSPDEELIGFLEMNNVAKLLATLKDALGKKKCFMEN